MGYFTSLFYYFIFLSFFVFVFGFNIASVTHSFFVGYCCNEQEKSLRVALGCCEWRNRFYVHKEKANATWRMTHIRCWPIRLCRFQCTLHRELYTLFFSIVSNSFWHLHRPPRLLNEIISWHRTSGHLHVSTAVQRHEEFLHIVLICFGSLAF